MRKFLMAMLAFLLTATVNAEITNCTLDHFLTLNINEQATSVPMILEGKPYTRSITIVGLGSKNVTAKGNIFPAAVETQLIPINNNSYGSEWFYFKDASLNLSVIQLSKKKKSRDSIIIYTLGLYPVSLKGLSDLPFNVIYAGHCE